MELKVENRDIFGKSVNALRRQGFIPAEFYGHGLENRHLAVKKEDFRKVFKEAGENMVIYLLLDGGKQPALIHDAQEDFVSGEVIHVDFHHVRMDEKITAKIPLEFTGVAPAIKELGGILNKTVNEIEVEALPADLPHSIEVDISGLATMEDNIFAKDLKVSKGVKILLDPESVVASVTPPLKEEEVAPISVEEVKVEGEEEKKAEEESGENKTNETT